MVPLQEQRAGGLGVTQGHPDGAGSHLSQPCTLFNALLVLVSILLTSVIFVKRHGWFRY